MKGYERMEYSQKDYYFETTLPNIVTKIEKILVHIKEIVFFIRKFVSSKAQICHIAVKHI